MRRAGLQHRFLTGVRRLKGSSDDNGNDLMTKTDWDGNTGLKSSEEDENGSFTYYLYDDYLRLFQVQNHSSVTVQRTDYAYSRDLSGTGNCDRASSGC